LTSMLEFVNDFRKYEFLRRTGPISLLPDFPDSIMSCINFDKRGHNCRNNLYLFMLSIF
jgi:hypothetical protein